MANDGRIFIVLFILKSINIQGMLRGIDQVTNVVLEDVEERIFSMDKGVEIEKYEVYLFRGDDV